MIPKIIQKAYKRVQKSYILFIDVSTISKLIDKQRIGLKLELISVNSIELLKRNI